MTSDVVSRAWWTLALTVLTAAVGGTVVSVPDPVAELRYVLLVAVVVAPVIYVLLGRCRSRWLDPHPFARFLLYFFAMFVAVVSLDAAVNLTLGTEGAVVRGLELLAVGVGVGVAVWATFGDGADRGWRWFVDATDLDW